MSALATTENGHNGLVGHHLQQQQQGLGNVQVVDVPVLDVRDARWVEVGTGLVVAVGCGWVVWCLLAVVMGGSGKRGGGGERKKVD